ncbi:MAG: MotA/TolQ/ExbB proton channel family protein [Chromatiales bacterium]
MKNTEHFLLLTWLLTVGLIVFGTVVCLDTGLIQVMIETDRSMICLVVIAIYVVGLAHSLWRTWYLSRELNLVARTQAMLDAQLRDERMEIRDGRVQTLHGQFLPDGFISRYIVDLVRTRQAEELAEKATEGRTDILEAYASEVRSAHEFGWFVIDLMLKVGFLGTLIGFIMMLGSVSQQELLDASMMQRVLKQMSFGMSTALNTTLVSLVTGILLSVPYYLLGRGLDELLESTIRVAEVEVWPRLRMSN